MDCKIEENNTAKQGSNSVSWFPESMIKEPSLHLLIELNQISIDEKRPSGEIFECTVCTNFKCRETKIIKAHINDKRHWKRLKIFYMANMARNMPQCPRSLSRVINGHLIDIYEDIKLDESRLLQRTKLCQLLNQKLADNNVEGCKLIMYGSSTTGLGTKCSDLNLLLKGESNDKSKEAMELLYVILQEDVEQSDDEDPSYRFIDVNENGDGTVSKFSFIDLETNIKCEVLPSVIASDHLTKLISKYSKIDDRANKLMCLFRHWGKVCKIDEAAKGTLPGHAFYIMVIHYLQQRDPPILPVLQEELPQYFMNNRIDNLNPEHVLKELTGRWTPSENKSLKRKKSDGDNNNNLVDKDCLASLWVGLLKYYGFELDTQVIQIHQKAPLLKSDRNWKGAAMKFCIADPFSTKRNLTKCINHISVRFIEYCLQTTWKYYSIPQSVKGPLFGGIVPDPPVISDNHSSQYVRMHTKYFDLLKKVAELLMIRDESLYKPLDPLRLTHDGEFKDFSVNSKSPDFVTQTYYQILREAPHLYDNKFPLALRRNIHVLKRIFEDVNKSEDKTYSKLVVLKSHAKLMISQVEDETLYYHFENNVFTAGKCLPLYCKRCEQDGHLAVDCPLNKLEPVTPLPKMEDFSLRLVDRVCQAFYDQNHIPDEEIKTKKAVVESMMEYLQRDVKLRRIRLQLFGSSVNGFGLKNSDMDICATFEGIPYNHPEVQDKVQSIKQLAERLMGYEQVSNIQTITTAKVPIIKFTHQYGFAGDISFYNELALENTRLLKAYSDIDKRVAILVLMMKKFVKMCGIGEASMGGLSSYGYTLMVIYFLQKCNPPVLPVLQELELGDRSKDDLCNYVQGWFVYFAAFTEEMKKKFIGKNGENNKSAGELWMDLLKFYAEEFDLRRNVIDISEEALMTKHSSDVKTNNISIIDPFDSHNLGSALSSSMNVYIVNQLRGARDHFGRNIEENSFSEKTDEELMNWYFDSYRPNGEPPIGSRCYFCKKIGHVAKNCPEMKMDYDKWYESFRNKREQRNNGDLQQRRGNFNNYRRPFMRPNNSRRTPGESNYPSGQNDRLNHSQVPFARGMIRNFSPVSARGNHFNTVVRQSVPPFPGNAQIRYPFPPASPIISQRINCVPNPRFMLFNGGPVVHYENLQPRMQQPYNHPTFPHMGPSNFRPLVAQPIRGPQHIPFNNYQMRPPYQEARVGNIRPVYFNQMTPNRIPGPNHFSSSTTDSLIPQSHCEQSNALSLPGPRNNNQSFVSSPIHLELNVALSLPGPSEQNQNESNDLELNLAVSLPGSTEQNQNESNDLELNLAVSLPEPSEQNQNESNNLQSHLNLTISNNAIECSLSRQEGINEIPNSNVNQPAIVHRNGAEDFAYIYNRIDSLDIQD